MFQIAIGIPSDTVSPSWWGKIFRDLFFVFDNVIYTVITWLYQILFYIADADIFTKDVIAGFYERVQIILGVFMIFKLSVSLLKIAINPDMLTDKKNGLSQIISRVIIMLAMFTAIRPLNIPEGSKPDHSYNYYLDKNGILFGTLYSLQHRVLTNNTIGKLILGNQTTANDPNHPAAPRTTSSNRDEDFADVVELSANYFSSSVLRGFLHPNLKPGETDVSNESAYVCAPTDKMTAGTPAFVHGALVVGGGLIGNALAPGLGLVVGGAIGEGINQILSFFTTLAADDVGSTYDEWRNPGLPPIRLTDNGNVECDSGYAYAYLPIVSTAVGIIIILMLIGYCLDVAIRTLKLAILRFVAPIAILSYVDPQSSEKGAFASWVKLLIRTYVDLFIRLAILFLVVFFSEEIFKGNLDIGMGSPLLWAISRIVLIIALFYFARQAPKFIMDALGIKSMGFGVGMSGIMGGVGALVGGGGLQGLASGFMNASQDAADAAAQGKQVPPAYSTQRDKIAKLRTGDKEARGGLLGRAQGAANDRTNAGLARRMFGLDREKVSEAKDKKYEMEAEAAEAQDRYDRFKDGTMSDYEKNMVHDDFKSSGGYYDSLVQDAINNGYISSAADADKLFDASSWSDADDWAKVQDMVKYHEGSYLRNDASTKATDAKKQGSAYEEGDKLMSSLNINESLQEKYSRVGVYRSRRIGDTAENESLSGRREREFKVDRKNRGTRGR